MVYKARHPTQNPYFSGPVAPQIDIEEVKINCLEVFELISTSSSLERLWVDDEILMEEGLSPDWEFPTLVGLHHHFSEPRLTSNLQKIAFSVRLLTEIHEDHLQFKNKLDEISAERNFIAWNRGEGPCSLREACNKLIHANYFHPVYNNDDQGQNEGCWALTSEIELEGTKGKDRWLVTIYAYGFLEAVLDCISTLE